MSVTRRHATWTWDTYLEWEARQDLRYELVDGDVHDMIWLNIGAERRARLRGSPCRAHGSNLRSGPVPPVAPRTRRSMAGRCSEIPSSQAGRPPSSRGSPGARPGSTPA